VVPSDMVFISPFNGVTTIHLKDNTRLYSQYSIDTISSKLTEPYFVRIHRSIIINLGYIKNYQNHNSNVITLINGEELSVQKEYRQQLFGKMLKI